MYPTATLVAAITTDRIREAEAARRARTDLPQPAPRRTRAFRALRIAFAR